MFMRIGVYHRNLPAIERCIISIKKNAKKHLRSEILEYIRICKTKPELEISEQFINFQNGLYDIINKRLIEHSPAYFTTIQIHANYIDYEELSTNKYVEQFLDDIMCRNVERKKALLQIIGYSMTCKTDLQLAFFFYRTKCKKSENLLL